MTTFHLRGALPIFGGDFLSRPHRSRGTQRQVAPYAGPLGRAVGACVSRLREQIHRRQVMAELFRLSDRELADIGLNRSDIRHIYSLEFAARRDAERSD